MAESSNSAASVHTLAFREYLKPTEPIYQTIHRGQNLDKYEVMKTETAADDLRFDEVRRNAEISIDQLQDNFQNILHFQVKGVTSASVLMEPSSTTETTSSSLGFSEDNFIAYHCLSEKECQDLNSIALRMKSKGRLDKLVRVYVKERKSFMNMHFQKLWDEKLSSIQIQRLQKDVMKKKIVLWIRAAEYSFRRIFGYEKQLSNQVFKDLGNAIYESCFISIVEDSANQLFDFAEAVSSCRRYPEERLQMILQIYRRLSDLMPEINLVFQSEMAEPIRGRAGFLLCKCGEVVNFTLSDFEDAVLGELSNNPIPGGTIHSLTKNVMNYTTGLIAENRAILMTLITSRPSKNLGLLDCSELQGQSLLGEHLVWIIRTLQLKLQDKSKYYQDPRLSHLFMMNNVHYIAQKIGQSEALTEIVGKDHLRKLTENVEKSLTSYLTTTAWDRLVYSLRDEGLQVSWSFTSSVSKSVLKQRFKAFNDRFQEILKTHVTWVIPDDELRSKVCQCILEKLIPPYRNFVVKFGSHVEKGSCLGRCAIYSVEEIEALILSLFGYH